MGITRYCRPRQCRLRRQRRTRTKLRSQPQLLPLLLRNELFNASISATVSRSNSNSNSTRRNTMDGSAFAWQHKCSRSTELATAAVADQRTALQLERRPLPALASSFPKEKPCRPQNDDRSTERTNRRFWGKAED